MQAATAIPAAGPSSAIHFHQANNLEVTMAHLRNHEPRRLWNEWSDMRAHDLWLEDEDEACVACGARENICYATGAPFCVDCLEHAKKSHISEDFDDLGVGD